MGKEKKFRFLLQLNIDEWGMYKKGEIETFWIDLLDVQCGLVRWPIEKHWDILRCDDFTGKTDINGNDIYEEDIVRFKTKDIKGVWSDELHEGTINFNSDDGCFFIFNSSDDYPFVKFENTKEIEIIGK